MGNVVGVMEDDIDLGGGSIFFGEFVNLINDLFGGGFELGGGVVGVGDGGGRNVFFFGVKMIYFGWWFLRW